MKKKLYSAFAAILFSLLFISSYYFYFRYQPIINWQPQHYLRVSGQITPRLLSQQQIFWTAVYSSTNPLCQYDVTWFEGADVDRQRKKNFIIKLSQDGHFTGKIPLDYYLPGYCQWRITTIGYRLSNPLLSKTYALSIAPIYSEGDPIYMAYFNFHSDKKQTRRASLILSCRSNNQCNIKKNSPFNTYMNPHLSYQFKLTILAEHP